MAAEGTIDVKPRGSPDADGVRRTPTTTVVLHGRLAKEFGRRHEIGVETAAGAAYALCALHPGFKEAFQDGCYRVIRGSVAKGLPLSEGMLHLKIGRAGEIHFLPAARGSKQGGAGKIIIGAIIIIAAIVTALPSGGASIAGAAAALGAPVIVGGVSLGITFGSIALFGASILLAGISSVISPQNKNNSNLTDQRASFGLSGSMNSVQEGSIVPVVYGRQRVGSVVASFGYSAQDYSPTVYLADGVTPVPSATTQSSGAVGSGGGGKGGGHGGAKEAPNTLRSDAVVRIIDLLSEGPIGGLVDGAKSIYFNGTPLQASDGTYNFQGVTWQEVLGYPDQAPVPGYPAAEQTLSSELGLPAQVKALLPKIVTVNSPTATAVRLTIHIPTYITQDPKTGDIQNGPPLHFYFEIRPAGGGWIQVASDNITNGKCVTAYQRSYRVDLPGATNPTRATSWDIRMTRVSPDDPDSSSQSQTFLDEVTLITDHRLSYSNTAYMALTIDAASFGGQIPTREYEIDGIICQVPLNYDALGHTYATTGPGTSMGTWDGASWKPSVTSNPAWCLYDMMSNARYGMGLPPGVLAGTRYDLFPLSQYCDGRVPSGFLDASGAALAELRYQLNVIMSTQDDAYRVIQSMASAFRGMTYWGAGRVVVTADLPTTPSAVMNQTNVVDGEFNYEGTSLKTRHTVARVAWQDPLNSYKTAIEVVEDFAGVVTYGQFATDVHAFGCTSRGLAHRMGKWLLDTEKTQNETVTCKTGMEHLRVRPGDVALVTDPAFVGQVMGGRCAPACETAKIFLDRVIDGPADLYFSLTVNLPDGTVGVADVSSITVYPGGNNGNSIVSLLRPLALAPDAHASWVLSSHGTPGPHGTQGTQAVTARQFRVLGVAEPERGTFSITAVNHDPNKYARVEYGIQFDPTPYSILGTLLATPIPPPANVFARDYITGVGNTTLVRTTVSCNPANDPRVVGQQFRASGPEQRIEGGSGASFDFDNLQLGTYIFSVRSSGRDGRASIWVDSVPVLVDGLADAPTPVTGFTAAGGAMSVDITFTNSTARDLLHYELWRSPAPNNGTHPFPIAAFQPTGTPAANGATLLAAFQGTTYHDSGDVLGPDKAWAYWLRPVNTTLVPGAFVGPAKALTTYYITNNLEQGIRDTAVFAAALLGGAPTNVTDLTVAGTREGQLIFNQTDKQLYSWDNAHQVWVKFIPLIPDSTGKLTAAQVGALNNVNISGSLTPEQTAALIAGIGANGITSDKIASLVGSKVTGLLTDATMKAGQIYDVDPVTGNSVVGVNTNKLLGSLAATKIVDQDGLGNIIPGINANRIAGKIPTTQLAGNIAATVIVDQDGLGNIIPGVNANRIQGRIPTSQLVGGILDGVGTTLSLAALGITGVLMAANIAALDTLNGTIVGTQISPDTITAPMIKAGEINAKLVNTFALQTQNIAAGAITTAQLAVGSPNNSIANSCFAYSAEGWAGLLPVPVLGTGDEAGYGLQGLGAGRFNAGVLAPNGQAGSYADSFYTAGATGTGRVFDAVVAVQAGECWEAQATFIPIGGTLEVILIGVTATGAESIGATTGPQTFTPSPGPVLDKWRTLAVRAVIPAGTVAVSILLRFANPSTSSAAVGSFVTRTLLGKTVANATTNLGWTPGGVTSISGGLIKTDSIVARHLVAGAVVAGKLAAGAVTAETLAISSSTNVIWNPSCVLTTAGWLTGGSIPLTLNYGLPGYILQGEGTGYITSPANLPNGGGQEIYAVWSPTAGANGVPVTPGAWVEAQALLGAHRCAAFVQIVFCDASGAQIPGGGLGTRIAGFGGGNAINQYRLSWIKVQAPANAATAQMVIVGFNDGGADFFAVSPAGPAGQNPYVFFTRASFGASTPVPMAQSQPQPWAPGGMTQISGGMIQTATVLAKQLAANQISARELAVGNSANVIWNSCFAVATDGWSLSTAPGAAVSNFASCSTLYTQYGTPDGCGVVEHQLAAGTYVDVAWGPVACRPGDTFEAQALVLPVAATAYLYVGFQDAAGAAVLNSPVVQGATNQVAPPAATNGGLTAFSPVSLIATAPAGAAHALLVVRLQNNNPGQANGYSIITRAAFGLTFTGATQVSPWAAGGVTSISGGVIKTNSIVTRNLAVGAVTAETLAVSAATNVIWNPSCVLGTAGWQAGGNLAVTLGFALGGYTLLGEGTGYVQGSGQLAVGGIIFAVWEPTPGTHGVPCGEGDWIEGQALVAAHRCAALVQLDFFDANGNEIPGVLINSARRAGTGGGTVKGQYALAWIKGRAPAGSATARLNIVGVNDGGADFAAVGPGGPAGSNPYLFFTRAAIGASTPVPMAQSQPQPWAPGGVTQISGGMIQTATVLAKQLAANQISARELAVGNSSNQIWNSCFAVTTDGWGVGAGGGATFSNFNSCSLIYTQYNTLDGAGVVETQIPPGGYVDVYWQGSNCQAGDTLEAQVKVIPVGSIATLLFQWRDGNGTPIGASAQSAPTVSSGIPPGGSGLFYFFNVALIAVAPPGAAQALLILRLSSPQPGQANGFAIITHAAVGLTFAGATQVSPWAAGGITQISGGVIKTNSIVTRNLAAGSVTTNQLTVASAGNLIWNSTCPSTSSGWVLETSVASTQLGSVTGDALAPAGYALQGQGSGVMLAPSLPVGQTFHCFWDPDSIGGIPCLPGDWLEGQAWIGAHRCYGQVQIGFFGAGNASLGNTGGTRVAGPLGGTTLASYGFSWVKVQAPPGAQRAVFYIAAFNDGGADIAGSPGVSPYLFFTRALLGPSVPNATQPQPWQPGGITQISAGMLKTDSVTTRALSAGVVSAEKLSVGSVTNVIGNPCCSVSTFGWSPGIGRWGPGDAFALNGYGTGYAALGSQGSGAVADYCWAPNGWPYFPDKTHATPFGMATPCNPGEIWEVQGLFQTHRCSVELFVLFGQPNPDGSWTHIATASTGAQSWGQPGGGQYENEYHQLATRFTVPPTATLVTLMFRMGNTPVAQAVFGASAGANPYVMFTKMGLGPALPNVPRMPWGPGGRVSIEGGEIRAQSILANTLGAGAVTAGTIAAGAVTVGTIAAGAVTAANLTVGNPSNLVWNGTPDQGIFGWNSYTFGPSMPAYGDPNVHIGTAATQNANFALTGLGSGFCQYTGGGSVYGNQGFIWDWSPNPGLPGVPATSGATYGAAALLLAGNGLAASIQILFLNYNQVLLGAIESARVTTGGPNGLIEDYYKRVTLTAVAPAGTAFVILRLVGTGAPSAYQGFFAFTKAMIGQIEAGAQVGAWAAGGVTTISGNMIRTGSLDASRITAGSILAGNIAADQIQAFHLAANSVAVRNLQAFSITGDRIAANTIVGGNIQAAAIGADQIAANQLHAYHLAADFALISSAQIGLATIGTANIQDLTVNGQKIATGSISDYGYANNFVETTLPYGWTVLVSMVLVKKVGGTAMVLFLKSINDFISFSEPIGSSLGGSGA